MYAYVSSRKPQRTVPLMDRRPAHRGPGPRLGSQCPAKAPQVTQVDSTTPALGVASSQSTSQPGHVHR